MPDKECKFTFVWKIENFSMLPHQIGEELRSPKFVVDAWEKVDFCLGMFPRGEDEDVEGYMSLFLSKEPNSVDLKLNFTFAVESTEPSEELLFTVKDHVLQENWGFDNLMSLDDIYVKKDLYLPQDTLTIRCEISPPAETSTELNVNQESKSASTFLRKRCVSRTCILVQRRSITWTVRNVKKHIQRLENASVLLTTALKNSPSLKLTLNFNEISNDDDYIPITIQQTECLSEHKPLFVKCRITVSSTQEEEASKTSSHLFADLSASDEWSFPPLLTTSMLKDKKYLNVNDMLLLQCEFAFSHKDGVHHLENNYMPCTIETRETNNELSSCFENIYGCGKFCDVELRAGDRTFPYYKVILCARSSVFSAMFENDMREKNSNVVEIEDVDADTLQRMLTYMHSDVLQGDLLPEDACRLYMVADKYNLKSLKSRCSVLLATTVSVVNVCDLLLLTDAHIDSFLKNVVDNFISSHTAEVFSSAQWASFMMEDPKLACEVMHKMWTGKCSF